MTGVSREYVCAERQRNPYGYRPGGNEQTASGTRRVAGRFKSLLPALQQPLKIDAWSVLCRAARRTRPGAMTIPRDHLAPLLLKQLPERKTQTKRGDDGCGAASRGQPQHMTYTRPENFITSSGLGTMGFGLLAAVGAQVATDDTVICISGDGLFMMNAQELGTVKRKQPLKIVLLDNQRLGMVRQWQQLFFQSDIAKPP